MRERGEGAGVNARIVYWGVSGAGKRTNLQVIHAKLRPDHRGELREVPTRLDPTVCYALLPIELGEVGGVSTRIEVVTAPAGVEQAPTRKQLLDRADGVVFVADAQRERLEENLASFDELRSALGAYGRALEQVPLVIQYNKRDLADPFVLEELHRKLGMRGVAAFEAVAPEGTAVLSTLTTISKRVIRHRRECAAREASADREPTPPAGTTQILTRMVEPEPEPPLEPEPDAPIDGGLDPDLVAEAGAADALGGSEELEASFEPSFQEVVASEPDAFADEPARGSSLFAIKGLGTPARVDARSFSVPVELEDGAGRVRRVTLRLRIEAIEDGDA